MPKIRLSQNRQDDLQLIRILTDLQAVSDALANYYYRFYKAIVMDDCMPDDASEMAVLLHDAIKELIAGTEQAQVYIKKINQTRPENERL